MGLFDKFKKKDTRNAQSESADIPCSDGWINVFSACLGKAMVIQQNAAKYVVKGRNWNVDFSKGTISFGDDAYPVQFIGSESGSSNTWMWGWNNINHFPESVISLANEMLAKGEEWNLDPLKVPNFALNDMLNGHTLSIVACGISKDNYFYYRGPHSGGAVLLAVGNVPTEVYTPVNIGEFANLTMQCIQQYPVDHKIFAESLLQWNKTSYDWDGDTLVAHFQQDLYITFGQNGEHYCITSMRT